MSIFWPISLLKTINVSLCDHRAACLSLYLPYQLLNG
jgi:hypothetical protein